MDAALCQQLGDTDIRQPVIEVPPDGESDNIVRKAIPGKDRDRALGLAPPTAAAGVTGVHFTQAAKPSAISTTGHTNQTTVTTIVNTNTVSNSTVLSPTAVPATTVAPTVTTSVPAGMTAYVDNSLPYSLAYPSDWTTSTSTVSGVRYFRVVAPDENAEVFVGVQPSAYLDTTGLQSQLETDVASLVTSAGFRAISVPQYSSGSVNGVLTQDAAITIESSYGATGIVAAGLAYDKGEVYFMVGVVNNDAAPGASQEAAQLQNVANSFSLR